MAKEISLISGAGGFIGRHLSKAIKHRGRKVYGILLDGESNPYVNKHFVADVRDMGELEACIDPAISEIYHLAAIANVPESISDPRKDFETGALGTFNMLEIARKIKLRSFVFASSVSVLDSGNTVLFDESSAYGPRTPYGASKMTGEGYCKAYNECYGIPTKVARMFNVYGPGKKGLVIFDLIQKLFDNTSVLTILGDGSQVRDFLYIDDAVAGIQIVAERGTPGEVYHLASGKPVTIKELVKTLITLLDLKDVRVESSGESWKGDMPWYADITKAMALGFSPQLELTDGLARTIEWIRSLRS